MIAQWYSSGGRSNKKTDMIFLIVEAAEVAYRATMDWENKAVGKL